VLEGGPPESSVEGFFVDFDHASAIWQDQRKKIKEAQGGKPKESATSVQGKKYYVLMLQ